VATTAQNLFDGHRRQIGARKGQGN